MLLRMAFSSDYWSSYEHRIGSLRQFLEAVRTISAYQAATGTRFIWRGVGDADWGLHSRLVRAYQDKFSGQIPTETQLRKFEQEVLDEARDWGLDWHGTGGRLTTLELLAGLQHYGVPTRLLDFTYNPLIALWFAAEDDEPRYGRPATRSLGMVSTIASFGGRATRSSFSPR